MSKFSENLSRLMQEKLMSQAELSRRSGVSQRQLIMLKYGRSKPRLSTIGVIARALGVDVKDLIGGEGQ